MREIVCKYSQHKFKLELKLFKRKLKLRLTTMDDRFNFSVYYEALMCTAYILGSHFIGYCFAIKWSPSEEKVFNKDKFQFTCSLTTLDLRRR